MPGRAELGEKIRGLRGDMTQKEFAKLLGVSQGSVAKYESGRSFPKATVLRRIAALGGGTIEELLSETGSGRGVSGAGRDLVGEKFLTLSDSERRLVKAARDLKRRDPRLLSILTRLILELGKRPSGWKTGRRP